MGDGRPLVLLHGYLSTGTETWMRPGLGPVIAAQGYRLIMPDFRGHGDSGKPHSASAYPSDALVDDGFALVEHLGVGDWDLGGYSLGGRIVARMLARGASPARAIVARTGLEPIVHAAGRGSNYRQILSRFGTFEPDSMEWQIEQYIRARDGDPVALACVLDTFVDTPLAALGRVTVPTPVVAGARDTERGSVTALAAALPSSWHVSVPSVIGPRSPQPGSVARSPLSSPLRHRARGITSDAIAGQRTFRGATLKADQPARTPRGCSPSGAMSRSQSATSRERPRSQSRPSTTTSGPKSSWSPTSTTGLLRAQPELRARRGKKSASTNPRLYVPDRSQSEV